MRTILLIVVGLAFVVTATPSMAQKKNSSIYPWERKGEQLRRGHTKDPMAKMRAREQKALKSLGLLSRQKVPGFKGGPAEKSAPVGLDRYAGLDRNRDGSISRQEYMSGRFRPGRAGVAGKARSGRYQSRISSRFRSADRNGDGKVSAAEIGQLRNSRF